MEKEGLMEKECLIKIGDLKRESAKWRRGYE